MKHGLESQAKSTDFHGIFDLDTVRQHSNALPVFFGKLFVIVGIKCWALLNNKITSYLYLNLQ